MEYASQSMPIPTNMPIAAEGAYAREERSLDNSPSRSYRQPVIIRGKSSTSISSSGGTYGSYTAGGRVHDFQVHVHLIQVRCLERGVPGEARHPVGFATMLGKEEYTPVAQDTLSCVWDHLIVFRFPAQNALEFLDATVTVSVYDANTIRRKELVGSCHFAAEDLYRLPNRELRRAWAALVSHTTNRVVGFVQLSIALFGPNENPLRGDLQLTWHELEEEDERIETVPPSELIVNSGDTLRERHYLGVTVYRVEDLPDSEHMPQVVVQFAGHELATRRARSSTDPQFNQELQFAISLPTMCDRITLQVWTGKRRDALSLVGTAYLHFQDVLSHALGPLWVNLYGTTRRDKRTLEQRREINTGYAPAGEYVGRVLVYLACTRLETERAAIIPATPCQEPPVDSYTLRVDMHELRHVQLDGKRVRAEVTVGATRLETEWVVAKDGAVEWMHCFRDVLCTFSSRVAEIPDLIVHFVVRKNLKQRVRIGYMRWKMADLMGFQHPPVWREMVVDPFASDALAVEHDVVPLIKLRIGFGRTQDARRIVRPLMEGSVEDISHMRVHNPQSASTPRPYELRVHLYQCRNLALSHAHVFASASFAAFCEVRLCGHVLRTNKKPDTRHPQWYETLTRRVDLSDDALQHERLCVRVLEYDMALHVSDLIGQSVLPCSTLKAKWPGEPQWRSLSLQGLQRPRACGELLLSAQLIPLAEVGAHAPHDITPVTRECLFELSVVGLRNLLAFERLPVQAAYMEFDCGQRAERRIVNTPHTSEPSADSPNYLAVLQLPVNMPLNPLYAPMLNIAVYDYRRRGGSTPLIARSTIPMEHFLPGGESLARSLLPERVAYIPGAVTQPGPEGTISTPERIRKAQLAAVVKGSVAASGGASGAGHGGAEKPDVHWSTHSINAPSGGAGAKPRVRRSLLKDSMRAPLLEDIVVEEPLPRFLGRTLPEVEEVVPGGVDLESGVGGDVPLDVAVFERRPQCTHEFEHQVKEVPFDEYEIQRDWPLYGMAKDGEQMQEWCRLLRRRRYFLDRTFCSRTAPTWDARRVGTFKARFRCLSIEQLGQDYRPVNLQHMFTPRHFVVRVHVVRCIDLVPVDEVSAFNPFVRVHIADEPDGVIVDREHMQHNQVNPQFYFVYELRAQLPGRDTTLEVSVFNSDVVGHEELVGTTRIDLENRLFSGEWKRMELKPREFRTLWSPSSTYPQGICEMWVDVMSPQEASTKPMVPFEAPPPRDYELRVVVWRVEGVPFPAPEASDIVVVGFMDGGEPQQTDTHVGAKDGTAAFHWRFIFSTRLPAASPRLKLQVWDRDHMGPDDVLCETNVNLHALFARAYAGEHGVTLDRQWLALRHPLDASEYGRVQVSIEAVPEAACTADSVLPGNAALPPPPRAFFQSLGSKQNGGAGRRRRRRRRRCAWTGGALLLLVGAFVVVAWRQFHFFGVV